MSGARPLVLTDVLKIKAMQDALERGVAYKYLVPDRASSKGRAIRQVEILSNKLLTTAFEASLECVTVM